MNGSFARARIALAALMLWSTLQPTGWMAGALAQSRSPIDEATEYYQQSRFDDAITLLRGHIERGALAGDELQRARELIARSYVKKGSPAEARETFRLILRGNPQYRPDPIRVPPDEIAVFDEALKEHQAGVPAPPDTTSAPPLRTEPTPAATMVPETEKKGGLFSKWWVWALGAVVVGGAVAAASGSGGGDEETTLTALRQPPPPPP